MSTALRSWPPASAAEIGVARHGLSAAGGDGPLAEADWPALVDACTDRGLLGLLADAVAQGVPALTDTERADLVERVTAELGLSLRLERELLEVAEILDAQAVPFRVLKGAANAHLDYPDPALRLFGDIDIIVPSSDIDVGRAGLEAAGYVVTEPLRRAPVEFRFEKGITARSPRGFEVDVHRVLISGVFGECWDPMALFDTTEQFSVGGVDLPALAREERFIHACIAGTIGDEVPRLRPARDVAQQLLAPELDPERVIELAGAWGLRILVARAVLLSTGWLALDAENALTEWAASYRATPREQVRLALFSRARLGLTRRLLGSVLEMHGVRNRVAFAGYCVRNRPVRGSRTARHR